MKILLTVGKNIYAYQKHILRELQELPHLEISLLISPYTTREKPRDNKVIKILNAKFPLYRTDPYTSENTEVFVTQNSLLKSFQPEVKYDCVINFCADISISHFNIRYGEIIKPKMEVQSWYGACITGRQNTTLHLLHSHDHIQYLLHSKSLTITTEAGTYNNRNKALYHFSYLLKSLFNDIEYAQGKGADNYYTHWQELRYHSGLLLHIIKRKFSISRLNWKIAILEDNKPRLLNTQSGIYWADPFIVSQKDEKWIFFEEIDQNKRQGKISVVKLNGANISDKRTVLEQPYHLSFPNVFRSNDRYFMLPEQSAAGVQDIYRATAFPYRWEKLQTILPDMKAVDPVFIFYRDKYWLFFNKIEEFEHENNERLYLYFSDDLFSDQWKSHPQNPVIIDESKARNAGKIISEGEEFIRVAQNCKERYGADVSKNRIKELTEFVYREESLQSSWDFNNFQGFHTYNTDGNTTVIDLRFKEKKSFFSQF